MMAKLDTSITGNLRKKLTDYGEAKLSDEELLCLIVKTGDELKDVMTLSKNLLRRYGNIAALSEISALQLCGENKGLTPAKAAELKAALELGKRSVQAVCPGTYISCVEDAIKAAGSDMPNLKQEHFRVILLNTKNLLISVEEITVGTINSSLVHAREVFREAIAKNAYSVILMHNHPSTDPSPSLNDDEITVKMQQAGKVIGIKVADHIIIGGDRYYSYLGAGKM